MFILVFSFVWVYVCYVCAVFQRARGVVFPTENKQAYFPIYQSVSELHIFSRHKMTLCQSMLFGTHFNAFIIFYHYHEHVITL